MENFKYKIHLIWVCVSMDVKTFLLKCRILKRRVEVNIWKKRLKLLEEKLDGVE